MKNSQSSYLIPDEFLGAKNSRSRAARIVGDKGSEDVYYKRPGRRDSLQPHRVLRFSLNGPFKWAQLFTTESERDLARERHDEKEIKWRDEDDS